jgi:sugar phosphate isomerase/epimerase
MFPSACVWDSGAGVVDVLRQVKQTAFHYIDVEPATLDAPEAFQAWKELGLSVSCVELDHKLPPGCSLDSRNPAEQRQAVDHLKQALVKSQAVGACVAYVGSCARRGNLESFARGLRELADDAAGKNIKLCVEHVPGRALSTAREALAFVQKLDHPNLFLLVDVGHTILTRERAWEVIAAAGPRLGYVQLNDNDGRNDRHWALLDGRLTPQDVAKVLEALSRIGYSGTLGLELSKDFASLISGLSRNRNLLLRLQEPAEPKSLKEPESRRKG